jgi:hypothetical protein
VVAVEVRSVEVLKKEYLLQVAQEVIIWNNP